LKKQNKKRAHLLGFIQHGVNSHATGMWRHPKDKVGWHFARPDYWQHMARTMERGLFDAMFIADELAPYNTHEDSSDAVVEWACSARRTSRRPSCRSSPPRPSTLASA
jgi:alkanesulfonate monooxygenase SsuD/methylene tetrahydromethanopterin reductase-like flavin-dependent oxidoreductase (luciferase family)